MNADVKYSNVLASESSVYLQQHASNPVAWQPWSDDAFAMARERDVPVLLSIGYSTCHWCHVMAHESFADLSVAEFLNEHYVCIKVDREERPDIDAICMDVCQATTGHGGWPLTVMMDADRRPFFAGTYFPRYSQHGRLGFLDLAKKISAVWTTERHRVESSAGAIVEALEKGAKADQKSEINGDVFDHIAEYHTRTFDETYGGFGSTPKFPSPHHLLLLLRISARTGNTQLRSMVLTTLQGMRAGGLFDQVGFGFHRYSTDQQWHIPHFEKMLYDQAMHLLAYTEGWQSTGDVVCKRTVFEVFDFLQRCMTSASGAFVSAIDADSGGREGSYYLCTNAELCEVDPLLGCDGSLGTMLGVTSQGNYREEATGNLTGENLLYVVDRNTLSTLQTDERWQKLRLQLLAMRDVRPKPITDTKVLPDWNGLMIVALAKAARVFGSTAMLEAATKAFSVLQPRTQLLDDHAMLAWAGIELYQSTGDSTYLDVAIENAEVITTDFLREGIVYQAAHSVRDLPVQPRQAYDGAYPAGNSVAALVFVQLGVLLHRSDYTATGRMIIEQYGKQIQAFPSGYCMLLQAWDLLVHPYLELTIPVNGTPGTLLDLHTIVHSVHIPWLIVNYADSIDETFGFCTAEACERPLTNLDDVVGRLRAEVVS